MCLRQQQLACALQAQMMLPLQVQLRSDLLLLNQSLTISLLQLRLELVLQAPLWLQVGLGLQAALLR